MIFRCTNIVPKLSRLGQTNRDRQTNNWVQARQEQKQFCLSGFSGPKFFEKGSHWPLLCFLRGRRNPGKMRRFREEGPVTPSGFAGSIHEEHRPSRLGPQRSKFYERSSQSRQDEEIPSSCLGVPAKKRVCWVHTRGAQTFSSGSTDPNFMRGRRNPGKMRRFPLLVWVFPPKSGFAGSIHEEHKPSRLGPRIQIL